MNRYPPHAAPKPGRLSDGLTEAAQKWRVDILQKIAKAKTRAIIG